MWRLTGGTHVGRVIGHGNANVELLDGEPGRNSTAQARHHRIPLPHHLHIIQGERMIGQVGEHALDPLIDRQAANPIDFRRDDDDLAVTFVRCLPPERSHERKILAVQSLQQLLNGCCIEAYQNPCTHCSTPCS